MVYRCKLSLFVYSPLFPSCFFSSLWLSSLHHSTLFFFFLLLCLHPPTYMGKYPSYSSNVLSSLSTSVTFFLGAIVIHKASLLQKEKLVVVRY
jgi:hypothetical protein